jgi:hypothetical protein
MFWIHSKFNKLQPLIYIYTLLISQTYTITIINVPFFKKKKYLVTSVHMNVYLEKFHILLYLK